MRLIDQYCGMAGWHEEQPDGVPVVALDLNQRPHGNLLTHAVFPQQPGQSVHCFVIQRRVERAATLLRFGHSNITDIARETGFAHPTHMARWTRRLLGLTPRDLRRQAR